MIKRSLTKDVTLHLNKLIKIQNVVQLPFKALQKGSELDGCSKV
jgi:hypothetical protein